VVWVASLFTLLKSYLLAQIIVLSLSSFYLTVVTIILKRTPNAHYSSIKVRPWNKESFQRWVRPIGRHFHKVDRPALWHVTHQTSKYLPFDERIPVVLTVHDLNFLHMTASGDQPERIRQVGLRTCQKLVTSSNCIVTVSKYTATDLARHINVEHRRLFMLFQTALHTF